MLLKALTKFGMYLQIKRNVIIYFLITVGIPAAVALVWWIGRHAGIWFSLFLIVVAFLGAYLSGLLMWEFFMKGFSNRQARRKADSEK